MASGGAEERPKARLSAAPADLRRPLHYDEARALEVLDKSLADDLRHDLISVVGALAAPVAQGKARAAARPAAVSPHCPKMTRWRGGTRHAAHQSSPAP
jgi:hypothetical protein